MAKPQKDTTKQVIRHERLRLKQQEQQQQLQRQRQWQGKLRSRRPPRRRFRTRSCSEKGRILRDQGSRPFRRAPGNKLKRTQNMLQRHTAVGPGVLPEKGPRPMRAPGHMFAPARRGWGGNDAGMCGALPPESPQVLKTGLPTSCCLVFRLSHGRGRCFEQRRPCRKHKLSAASSTDP